MSAAGGSWPAGLAQGWHPVAHATELGDRPLHRMLMDTPLVLLRSLGAVAALLDRCPHRNVPLSLGQATDAGLSCAYHGWTFAPDGRCVHVPGSKACPDVKVRAFAAMEAAGLVWVSLSPGPPPPPDLPAALVDSSVDRFWWQLAASRARVLDAVENLLDPAHPHCLHPWLVRRPDARRPVQVRFSSHAAGAEARYDEAHVPSVWLPRLYEGRRTNVVARLLGPTTAQLAFESCSGPSLTLTVLFTPETQDRTRPYAHFATPRGWLPANVKRWLLKAFHLPVLRQDQAMLARQAAAIAAAGGADYRHGPLDLFGPVIWRLAHGEPVAQARREETFLL